MTDDAPRPDADLVAYLDGELTSGERRAVEKRLADDPDARRQLESLRRTFALLDFLPTPEPSPDFATRTLTRLSLVAPESRPTGATTVAMPDKSRGVARGAILAVGVLVAALAGFAAERAGPAPAPRTPPPRINDLPVIENLPLYWGADDVGYVRRLAESGMFDAPEPPAVDATPPEPDLPAAKRQELIDLFAAAPPPRREQMRSLDRELRATPPADAGVLWRTLEGYAAWLDRLPDADRRSVYAAPTADARFEAVRQLHERGWRDALPAPRRAELQLTADPEERLKLVARWKNEERMRRDEWGLARRRWEAFGAGAAAKPWPFSDPALERGVDDFLRGVLKVDPAARWDGKELPASCRLTREEYLELKLRHEVAQRDGYWLLYGAAVWRLAQQHPGLPEYPNKAPLVDMAQVPPEVKKEIGGAFVRSPELARRQNRGKWPEFALAVAEAASRAGAKLPEPLGPAKLDAMPPAVREWAASELLPKLTPAERDEWSKLEGRWPGYPLKMLELAKRHDLAVPGVTPPGPPSLWARYYGEGRP